MQTFISIMIALIIFGVLVLIHEFGHFIVAKKNGVVINEFSVGMGPRILSRVSRKSGTRYSLKILPLGGSCAMLGEDEDNIEEGSFNSKSIWARMAIVFAGPFFNFILAFILALIVISVMGADTSYVTLVEKNSNAYEQGLREKDIITEFNGASVAVGREIYLEQYIKPLDGSDVTIKYKRDGKENKINIKPDAEKRYLMGIVYSQGAGVVTLNEVTKDSPIAKAGVMVGDTIVAINDKKVASGDELNQYLVDYPLDGSKIKVTYARNGKEKSVTIIPEYTNVYSLGFLYNLGREKQSITGVVKYSFVELRYTVMSVLKSLKMLITGKVSANEVSGPVGIVDLIGDTYKESKEYGIKMTIMSLLNMAIMLSANLGVMNLLPIPALDGGRLFLYIIELITRKPIPKDKEGMIHFIGFVLLMGLMIFLLFNDVRKLI